MKFQLIKGILHYNLRESYHVLYITVKPRYPAFQNNMVLNDALNISKVIHQKQPAHTEKFSKNEHIIGIYRKIRQTQP